MKAPKKLTALLRPGWSKPLYLTASGNETGSSVLSTGDQLSLVEIDSNLSASSSSSTLYRADNQKDRSRFRKHMYCFTDRQAAIFNRLVDLSATKIGTYYTIDLYSKMNRETSVNDCNVLIRKCVEDARIAVDELAAERHTQSALKYFKCLREQGLPISEETYGPLLDYFIDMSLVKDFLLFFEHVRETSPASVTSLKCYEIKLWVRVDHEEKIQEVFDDIEAYDGENKLLLQETFLSVLCESDRKKEIMRLLDSMDITKFSSLNLVAQIFGSLGKYQMESIAEELLLKFKACDCAEMDSSNLIYSHVIGIPNLAAEDIISKFKSLHTKLEVPPSSASYEKLLKYCCDSLEVHMALELVDEMFELGLAFSLEALHSILQASSVNCDFNLVHRIYSVIKRSNLKTNSETFRSMIDLHVKMKDYKGAYSMLHDSEEMGVQPTVAMYHAIMVGYFREKKWSDGLKVFKEMKEVDLKPDAQTFSYLITSCNSEKDINKYYEEMKQSQISATKHVFKALITAYAACGNFYAAEKVLLDKTIPKKSINEIRSTLVQALASNGNLSDAFNIYEKIKEDGCILEPKAVMSLIEHLQSDEAALSKLFPLLETLEDSNYWLDGCSRVILYCVRYKHLRTAVNLLEQLRDQACIDELTLEVIVDKVFSFIARLESSLHFGLELLLAMKNELGITPSRKCLDFLLHACVGAKDLQSSLFVWQQYRATDLPYNTLSYLRMYQALLASGNHEAAEVLENKIPKDDSHVQCIIKACNLTYLKKTEEKKKEKMKTKTKKKKKKKKSPK